MKLHFCLLALIPCFTGTLTASWTLVNHTTAGALNGGSASVTTNPIPMTGADTLFVSATLYQANPTTACSVTDSTGQNTWSLATYQYVGGLEANTALFYAWNTKVSASMTVTLTCGPATYPALVFAGFSGGLKTNPLDPSSVTGAISTSAQTTFQAGSSSPASGELVFAVGGVGGSGGTITSVNGGFSLIDEINYAAGSHEANAAAWSTATGSAVNPAWSLTGGNSASAMLAGFKSNAFTSPPLLSQAFSGYAASTYPNGPYIYSGASPTLTFTVQNPNSSAPLSGIAFSDTLPTGLAVASPNGLTGSCPSGTISAVAGSSLISLSGAAVSASASCSFSVNLTPSVTGLMTNTTGAISATQSGAGYPASAALTVYGPPSLTVSNIIVSAVTHASMHIEYQVSGTGSSTATCQLQYGISSGSYVYTTFSGPTYTPSGFSTGCQLDISGLQPGTTYYVMPTVRPDQNDSTGICLTGGSCGISEQTVTTLPAPNPHPAPPTAPTNWNPVEPNVSTYTVVSMQADPSTGYCVAAGNVPQQTHWSSAVTAGDSFQQVVNEIWYDTVIEFPEGTSCYPQESDIFHSGIVLPAYAPVGGPNDWVMIRTRANAPGDLPAFGFRTGPQFASKLATIVVQNPVNVPGTYQQSLVGQIFACVAIACSHFWIENLAFTHAFNSTIYPGNQPDPDGFGSFTNISSTSIFGPNLGYQWGTDLAGC